jgi:pimeloyl-ACP methyl ester carboxylesterase
MSKTPTIVLVHGAWANGSSWSKVIPQLLSKGLEVVAVHLPLKSLADDAASVKRAIALQEEPVILAGHSYGGAVITEAGIDPKVKGLVYAAAFAPDAGESAGSLGASVEPAPLGAEIRPDSQGYLRLTKTGIAESFAQDLSDQEKDILFVTQAPPTADALGGAVVNVAWKDKPSRYIVANNDRAIQPSLERAMASKIGATTIAIDSSHVVMLSHPQEVTQVIVEAAEALR